MLKMPRSQASDLVSIVIPAHNEQDTIPQLHKRLLTVMEQGSWPFEMIVVDDGSTDQSLEILKRLKIQDPRVKYLSLSRKFGHQSAILAGLEHSTGNAVISMDADLQHPPELVQRMLELWRHGYEVVYTVKREDRSLNPIRRTLHRLFYWVLSKLSGMKLSFGQTDFRLMDRKVVDAICNMPERKKFLRGLVSWIGFRQTRVEYDVPARFAGESKLTSLRHRLGFALDGILTFSVIPLRVFIFFGLFVSTTALLYGAYVTGLALHDMITGNSRLEIGWATVVSAMMFIGGIQLIGMGTLGEYLIRVFEETKQRPSYLIREKSVDSDSPIQKPAQGAVFTTLS